MYKPKQDRKEVYGLPSFSCVLSSMKLVFYLSPVFRPVSSLRTFIMLITLHCLSLTLEMF